MNEKANSKKELGRMLIGAFGAITACALLFNALTESAMAAELAKTEVVATSYNTAPLSAAKSSVPEGYSKADYTVVTDDLEYFKDKKPTTKDLSMEEAAELGAQAVWELWGVELTDAVVYMGYQPGTEDFPRATWSGDVRFGKRTAPDGTPGDNYYYFTLDAVTGDRNFVGKSRTLSVKAPLGLDMELAKHPETYTTLAREWAERHGFVRGAVQSAEYASQGYSDNDPQISIYVTGEGGEKALLGFSRYDQALMGVSYPASVKQSDAVGEKHRAEVEKQMEEQQKKGGGGGSGLVALS